VHQGEWWDTIFGILLFVHPDLGMNVTIVTLLQV
jgi:hypothetical protein